MIIGVPRELKPEEQRVAITPPGAAALIAHGHRVLVERGAGRGSGLTDDAYREAGAELTTVGRVWGDAELVLKVKEPVEAEYRRLRSGLMLFTYLHLASVPPLAHVLTERRVTALGYETLELDDGGLPLLAPMSEIAGRLAIQVGGWCLEAQNGGSGVLLSGASGVRPGKVVILGAGIAGANACQIAVGIGADVSVIERNPAKLRYLHDILGGHLATLMSNRANVEEEVRDADLVVGAVLIPGARAPRLVTADMVRRMRPGAAIVDISIDQGGCVATAKPTTHDAPTYRRHGVVHYCVTNMPGVVPHTSTFALTNATLEYVLAIADRGLAASLHDSAPLRRAVNTMAGHVTHPAVAEAVQATAVDVTTLL